MACDGLYLLLCCRHTGGTADQENLAQLCCSDACIVQSILYRDSGSLNQVLGQLIELCSGQVHIQMLRAVCGCSDERKVDVGGCGAGQLLLRLLCCFLQSLQSHLIAGKVYALGLLELVDHPLGYAVIKVIAAQSGIAVGCQNLDNAVADLDDGDIEGTAAQVVYHDLLLFFIVQAVSQSCGCRLVDDSLNLKACDLACVLGCLTLCVVEISRYGDNRLGYLLAQIALGICLQLLKNHGGNFLRCVVLAVDGYLVVAAHVSLDGRYGAVCVGNGLTLCRLADQSLAVLGKCHNRRGGTDTFRIRDNGGLAALHDCYTAIGCT